MFNRTTVAVAGAIALVIVAALAPPPAPARPTEKAAAIGLLLERRAEAVRARDKGAFMATVDPASSEFVNRQSRLFDAMQSIDFASYRLDANWERLGDLVRPLDRAKYPGVEDVVIPLTEERYRIDGFDPEEAAEDLFYTFVKRDGEWLIAEDTDLDDLALFSTRHLWDRGRLETRRSGHFLQWQHPCAGSDCLTLGAEFLPLAERGLARVDEYWHGPWTRQVIVLVPASQGELRRMLQTSIDLDNFVAFAYSTIELEHGIDFTGHRIILNPNAFEVQTSERVFTILSHELAHIATRNSSGVFIPTWVEEGFAEVIAYDRNPSALGFFRTRVEAGQFDERLPDDFEFTTGDGTDIYMSYQEAQSAVSYFIQRWGLDRFEVFYVRLGSVGISPGTTRYHVDRALRETVGVSLKEFGSAWAQAATRG
ncbi:MAG: hypothetical protein M3333_07165 [Actinomycetota bacterium]|nr:hypothetical protein [Actinomycetota bacterium]